MRKFKRASSLLLLTFSLNSFNLLNSFIFTAIASSSPLLAQSSQAESYDDNDWVTYRTNLSNAVKAYYEEKDYAKAIRLFDRGLEHAPEWDKSRIGLAIYLRGQSKFETNDFKGAISDLEKAVTLYPLFQKLFNNNNTDISNYYSTLAIAKFRLAPDEKITKEIKDLFEKSIKIDKTNGRSYFLYALSVKSLSSSIKIINRYIKIRPNDGKAYGLRGSFRMYKDGRSGAACADWNKALSLGYTDAESNFREYKWCKKYR